MGILDKITSMIGGNTGKLAQYQKIFSWIDNQGGVGNLLEKLRQGGLGTIVASWISSGNNLPISAEQIQSALGLSSIKQLAETLKVDTNSASSLIAKYLPKVIDGLSPNGEVAAHGNLVSEGLNLLKGKLFK